MPCWFWDKNYLTNNPSLKDGIQNEVEQRYRREGASLIMECGNQMGLYNYLLLLIKFNYFV